ncbi:MAG: alpha/beta hydrolase, partial [Chitinophagaceae bacterium]
MNKKLQFPGLLYVLSFFFNNTMAQKNYNLEFNKAVYKSQHLTLEGKTIEVRAYENIVYVQHPVDTSYQVMNIYIPEDYFHNKSINGYTATSAPVFFPNRVGGYMPAKPATALNTSAGNGTGIISQNSASAVVVAIFKGYIVASAGARGRTNKNQVGLYTGKSPAAIVDLKAAIRYLK